MGRIRRKFETEFKRQLIAQIEAGEITAEEAARRHQLSRSLIEYWRINIAPTRWRIVPSKRERQLEAENEKLKAKIGDLIRRWSI
jgi:transposase-like protein